MDIQNNNADVDVIKVEVKVEEIDFVNNIDLTGKITDEGNMPTTSKKNVIQNYNPENLLNVGLSVSPYTVMQSLQGSGLQETQQFDPRSDTNPIYQSSQRPNTHETFQNTHGQILLPQVPIIQPAFQQLLTHQQPSQPQMYLYQVINANPTSQQPLHLSQNQMYIFCGADTQPTFSQGNLLTQPLLQLSHGQLLSGERNAQPKSQDSQAMNFIHERNVQLVAEVPQMTNTQTTRERPYICRQCDISSLKESDLERHRNEHTGDKTYECSYCGKSVIENIHLLKHIRTHSTKKKYKCNYCEKTFSVLENLKIHIRIHTGEKPYECKHCDKAFRQKNHLAQHLKKKHNSITQDFQLQSYHHKINKQPTAKVHQSQMTNVHTTRERPYMCRHCDIAFLKKSDLERHMKIHTGDKIYECRYCDKVFTQNSHLLKHIMTHIEEEQYKCNYCEKTFSSLGYLKIHITTHTGEKPYKCSQCDTGFSTKQGLMYHYNSKKHKNNAGKRINYTIQCQFCSETFKHFTGFKYHMRIKHKTESRPILPKQIENTAKPSLDISKASETETFSF